MAKIKVGLSALHYPVTMARYFWDALDRRDDVEVYSTGPFFGNWIPWNGGMTIESRYVKTPTVPLPQGMSQHHIPYEIVGKMLPDDLDLFLMIDAGWHFSTRPKARVVALIETDPHVLKGHYKRAKSFSDLSFCMQTPYMDEKDIWLPYANDPTKFYPITPKPEPEFDACMIGLHYPQRDTLVHRLRSSGMRVYYDLGKVYDEYRTLYNRSITAISWSSMLDTPVRVFEAMGMGIPLIANNTPDIQLLFDDGEDYLGFDTVDNAVSLVECLVDASESDVEKMTSRALKKVTERHTWDHRIQFILEEAGLV